MTDGVLLLPALAAATAAALLVTPRSGTLDRLRLPSGARGWALAGGAVLLLVAVAGLEGRHLGLAMVAAVAGLGAVSGAERARLERTAHERRVVVVDFCEALVGELRAGQPVVRAIDRSVEVWPESEPVAAAARLNASMPDALRRLSALPGAAAVRRLAGAWEISAGTGSGLVLAVEQVLETARSDDAMARRVRAELASARATARLVTALPLVVLLAAQGIGARPWQFLLDTVPGVTCLAAGVVLSLLGLRWIDRIASSAVEDPAR